MRKYKLLILVLLCTFFISGCKKDEEENKDNTIVNNLAERYVKENLYTLITANDFCNASVLDPEKEEFTYNDFDENIISAWLMAYINNFGKVDVHGGFNIEELNNAYKKLFNVDNPKLEDEYNYLNRVTSYTKENNYYQAEIIATGCEGASTVEREYTGYEIKDKTVIIYTLVTNYEIDEENSTDAIALIEKNKVKYAYTFKVNGNGFQFVNRRIVK